MGVEVQFGRYRAFLRQGEWRCASADLEQQLNQEMESWIEATGGPALESADPEYDAAAWIAIRLNGKMRRHSAASRLDSGRTYFAKRQLKLALD